MNQAWTIFRPLTQSGQMVLTDQEYKWLEQLHRYWLEQRALDPETPMGTNACQMRNLVLLKVPGAWLFVSGGVGFLRPVTALIALFALVMFLASTYIAFNSPLAATAMISPLFLNLLIGVLVNDYFHRESLFKSKKDDASDGFVLLLIWGTVAPVRYVWSWIKKSEYTVPMVFNTRIFLAFAMLALLALLHLSVGLSFSSFYDFLVKMAMVFFSAVGFALFFVFLGVIVVVVSVIAKGIGLGFKETWSFAKLVAMLTKGYRFICPEITSESQQENKSLE